MKTILTALLLLLFPVSLADAQTPSRARLEADCEKISEALAYNACLAELGPRVGERRSAPPSRVQSGLIPVERRPGGRKAATFDVITRNR